MSAHSAGPWSIDADGCIFADGVCIGSIIPTNRAANGALIVAAPDMYAVLQELAECSQYWSEYDVPLGIRGRIAAALAKAVVK